MYQCIIHLDAIETVPVPVPFPSLHSPPNGFHGKKKEKKEKRKEKKMAGIKGLDVGGWRKRRKRKEKKEKEKSSRMMCRERTTERPTERPSDRATEENARTLPTLLLLDSSSSAPPGHTPLKPPTPLLPDLTRVPRGSVG